MAKSQNGKVVDFIDQQKPLCGKHTFPAEGNPYSTSVSVMIKKQEDAQRIYNDSELMAKMLEDDYVWNPTMKSNGAISYKFTKYMEINHDKQYKNDSEDTRKIHYKNGLRIATHGTERKEKETMLGLVKESKAFTKYQEVTARKLARTLNKSFEEALEMIQ